MALKDTDVIGRWAVEQRIAAARTELTPARQLSAG